MRPNLKSVSAQKGMALIAVIFIMVVIGSSISMMMKFSNINQAGFDQSLQMTRADLAAKSALAWGIYHAKNDNDCSNARLPDSGNPTDTMTLTAFTGFNMTVQCILNEYDGAISIMKITATAEYGSNPSSNDYVWRSISATVENF
ncbi:MAG: hypothetical protein HRU38_04420 [Saccharospirillaceae bacterium]|nr:hypothetical protein [Pseudomonadales bacterium]NRB77904.1 hypothetical protein [Saccharospirillaceae bacterium]